MADPVVHFEVIGRDPAALRTYYGELFGWAFDTSATVVAEVSRPGDYGFVGGSGTIPGGVGGGPGHEPHVLFYVGVDDVEAALANAERLGGKRRMDPSKAAGRDLVVAQFTDPEGNLVGVAGPA